MTTTVTVPPGNLPITLAVIAVNADGTAVGGAAAFSTGTGSTVASNVAAVTLLAANSSRRGASVYYDGAAILYLLLGSGTPTSANFTVQMGAGLYTYYEPPTGFTGIIKGIWSVAVGSAFMTEET